MQSQSLSAAANAAAPSLTPLINQLPDGINFSMLLTDGTVMAQDATHPYMWWKLTPDITGRYLNGTRSQRANLPETYSPVAASEAVLADGRVIIIGGEYSNFTLGEPFTLANQGAIYDPRTDTWSPLAPPPRFDHIGDSTQTVLPDGKVLTLDVLDAPKAELYSADGQEWTHIRDVPQQIETGPSRLEVVANGIASRPVDVWIHAAR